jgi:hypothetical protein
MKILLPRLGTKAFNRRVRGGTAAEGAEKTKIYAEACIGAFGYIRRLVVPNTSALRIFFAVLLCADCQIREIV